MSLHISIHSNPQAFLSDVIPGGRLETGLDALNVYRQNYRATLTDALADTFEAVQAVLGHDGFKQLSEEYQLIYPSTFYNLSDYGAYIPEFIGTRTWCSSLPYLADLAAFEWIFKEVFHKPVPASFPDYTQVTPESRFVFMGSLYLFQSDYSVYQLWKCRNESEFPQIEMHQSIQLAIFKQVNGKIGVIHLSSFEFDLLKQLMAHLSLDQALQNVTQVAELDSGDIHEFFAKVAQNHLIQQIET